LSSPDCPIQTSFWRSSARYSWNSETVRFGSMLLKKEFEIHRES
jgi:hypothetical protein